MRLLVAVGGEVFQVAALHQDADMVLHSDMGRAEQLRHAPRGSAADAVAHLAVAMHHAVDRGGHQPELGRDDIQDGVKVNRSFLSPGLRGERLMIDASGGVWQLRRCPLE